MKKCFWLGHKWKYNETATRRKCAWCGRIEVEAWAGRWELLCRGTERAKDAAQDSERFKQRQNGVSFREQDEMAADKN